VTALRIMVSRHAAFYSPIIGAIAGGFLAREGFEPTYTVATPERTVAQALAAGEVDVVQSAVSYNWTVLEKGGEPPMLSFAQINQRDGFFIAARSATAEFRWSDLLQGGLLYVHGGQPAAMLRYALHLRGIDLDRIPGIDRGSTKQMLTAFRAGEGAWFHEQGPYPQQLEFEGAARVVASVGEVIGPVSFSTVASRPEWLATPEARRFMRGYRLARVWANTAPPREIAAAERPFFPDIDESALAHAIAAYQSLGTWGGDIAIPKPLYETALDVFTHAGLIKSRHEYDRVVASPPGAD
jgi:NitT/TauT family transport system substrate-binding protein